MKTLNMYFKIVLHRKNQPCCSPFFPWNEELENDMSVGGTIVSAAVTFVLPQKL